MQSRYRTAEQDAWGSHHSKLYQDREDAARPLAERLVHYRDQQPLVLGLARGGVPLARVIAERLCAELDVIVARKISAPHQPELAVGAVTADGSRYLNQALIDALHVSSAYLQSATAEQCLEAQRREQLYRGQRLPVDVRGRVVILVDDGLATGATMRVCVRALRRAEARVIVGAAPVGSLAACLELSMELDELVCPWQPDPFGFVAAHYHDFPQLGDGDVQQLLESYHATWRAGEPAVSREGHAFGS